MSDKEVGVIKALDIMKWPRPERSGVIAVLVAYVLLSAYGEFTWLTTSGESEKFGLRYVKCLLLPMLCIAEDSPKQEVDEPITKHYRVVMLHPALKGTKKICTCHFDIHYFGKPVQHIRFQREQTCDSDYTQPRVWTEPIETPPSTLTIHFTGLYVYDENNRVYEMNHGQGEYRYHCE